ncbi:MAG: hypothetical protein V1793_18500 [Pseudomonadota bacterium]
MGRRETQGEKVRIPTGIGVARAIKKQVYPGAGQDRTISAGDADMIKIGFIQFTPDAADQVAQCYATLGKPPEQVTIRNTYVFRTWAMDTKLY